VLLFTKVLSALFIYGRFIEWAVNVNYFLINGRGRLNVIFLTAKY
jgi:hypothetical protein